MINKLLKGVKKMFTSDDKKRYTTHADRALELFKQRSLFNYELADIALQYNKVIYDLRRKGYTITKEFVSPGVYLYSLVGSPNTGSDQPESSEVGTLTTV